MAPPELSPPTFSIGANSTGPNSPSRIQSANKALKSPNMSHKNRGLMFRQRSMKNVQDSFIVDDYDAEDDASMLHVELDAERRKNAMLESELKLALAASHQAEKAHQAELASMDADRKRLLAERRHLLSKLTDIEVVEDSVKELYVQMKDRMAEDGMPTPEQLAAEKAALADEHVLVVEAEADLTAQRAARGHQEENKLAAMRAALRALEAEVRAAHQDTAAANMRADLAEDATEALQADASTMAAAMAAQHHELLSALKAATAEAHVAKRAAATALDEGRKRDTLVLANRQLESARHFDRVTQDKELRRLQAAHEIQLSAMHRELYRLSELMSENSLLNEQLQRALQGNRQLKQSAHPGRVRDLEQRIRHLESQLSASERRRANLEEEAMQPPALVNNGSMSGQAPGSPGAAFSRSGSMAAYLQNAPSPRPTGFGGLIRDVSGDGTAQRYSGHGMSGDGTAATGGGGVRQSSDGRRSVALSARSGVGGAAGQFAGNSMLAKSMQVMANARAVAARAAREKAKERPDDPVYNTIANVGLMHKATQQAIKGMKTTLAEAGLTKAGADAGGAGGVSVGLGPGGYRSVEKQATGGLEAVRLPQKNKGILGAAGYNNTPPPGPPPLIIPGA